MYALKVNKFLEEYGNLIQGCRTEFNNNCKEFKKMLETETDNKIKAEKLFQLILTARAYSDIARFNRFHSKEIKEVHRSSKGWITYLTQGNWYKYRPYIGELDAAVCENRYPLSKNSEGI